MRKWKEHSRVKACPDCLTVSANGPGDIDPDTAARVVAGLAAYGPGADFYPYTDPDTGEWLDSGFTWGPCEVCGLALGHDYVRGSVMWIAEVTA